MNVSVTTVCTLWAVGNFFRLHLSMLLSSKHEQYLTRCKNATPPERWHSIHVRWRVCPPARDQCTRELYCMSPLFVVPWCALRVCTAVAAAAMTGVRRNRTLPSSRFDVRNSSSNTTGQRTHSAQISAFLGQGPFTHCPNWPLPKKTTLLSSQIFFNNSFLLSGDNNTAEDRCFFLTSCFSSLNPCLYVFLKAMPP